MSGTMLSKRLFDLEPDRLRGAVGRFTVLWEEKPFSDCERTGSLDACSLELVDPKTQGNIKLSGLCVLRQLKKELDRFVFIVEAMRIDTTISEQCASDLFGRNGITIECALKHGLIKGQDGRR